MITSFEPVYKELEKLLIEKLPDYIQKINKKYNGRVMLKTFENTELEENCLKTPCFRFLSHKATFTEKDRIIGFTEFNTDFEIKLGEHETYKICRFWRYVEAIKLMLSESETEFDYDLNEADDFKFTIRVTVEF